ncbi:MAG TPA: hypothetical protein DEF12_16000 [Rhodobacteraceae bacterium]|nr:hypothetical protein [Paracoccaceae bacterium]
MNCRTIRMDKFSRQVLARRAKSKTPPHASAAFAATLARNACTCVLTLAVGKHLRYPLEKLDTA